MGKSFTHICAFVTKHVSNSQMVFWPTHPYHLPLSKSSRYSNPSCPTLASKMTGSEKLSQFRERAFRKKRFQFTLERVSLLFPELHGAGCSKL